MINLPAAEIFPLPSVWVVIAGFLKDLPHLCFVSSHTGKVYFHLRTLPLASFQEFHPTNLLLVTNNLWKVCFQVLSPTGGNCKIERWCHSYLGKARSHWRLASYTCCSSQCQTWTWWPSFQQNFLQKYNNIMPMQNKNAYQNTVATSNF